MEEKVKTDRKEDRRKEHTGNDKAEIGGEIKLSKTESVDWYILFEQFKAPVVTIRTAQWSLYVPPVVTICTAQWSLYVPHSGHYMYRTVVTICNAQWSLYTYVPPV
jgi:hypothetical protein